MISVQHFVEHLHITCICKNVILSQAVFTTSINYNWKCLCSFVLKNAECISMTWYLGPISEMLGELDFGRYFMQLKLNFLNFLNTWSYFAPPKTIETNYNLGSRTWNAFRYFVYLMIYEEILTSQFGIVWIPWNPDCRFLWGKMALNTCLRKTGWKKCTSEMDVLLELNINP